jgi:hypothetical protein
MFAQRLYPLSVFYCIDSHDFFLPKFTSSLYSPFRVEMNNSYDTNELTNLCVSQVLRHFSPVSWKFICVAI